MVSRTLSGHSATSSIASLGALDARMILEEPSESSFNVEDYQFVVKKQQQQKQRPLKKKAAPQSTEETTKPQATTTKRRSKPRCQSGAAVQNISNSKDLAQLVATNQDFPLLIRDESFHRIRQRRRQQQQQ